MSNKRTTKATILGWLASLEELPKLPGHKRKTIFYWRKLLKEAGINWAEAPKLATDRKKWKAIVVSRVEHIHKWETERAKHHQTRQQTSIHKRNFTPPPPSLTCEVCNKQCKTMAGLKIHQKRMHGPTEMFFLLRKLQPHLPVGVKLAKPLKEMRSDVFQHTSESIQTEMENMRYFRGRKVGFELRETRRKLHPSERTCPRRGERLEEEVVKQLSSADVLFVCQTVS